jgi:hypothetical protein
MRPTTVFAALVAASLAAGCTSVQTIAYSGQESECFDIAKHLTAEEEGGNISLETADTVTRRRGETLYDVVTVDYRQGPARRLITCYYRPGTRELSVIRYRGQDLSDEKRAEVLNAVR